MPDLKIVGLEGAVNGVTVQAQVTAKEIHLDRAVTWKQQAKGGPADLQYVGSGPATMTLEILFDGVGSATPVQPHVASLRQFTDVDAVLKRPPKIQVIYGAAQAAGVLPPFDAVIEWCSIRYLVFDPNGVALQAIVTLGCREAKRLKTTV
jgi:contractile injection system tube protein